MTLKPEARIVYRNEIAGIGPRPVINIDIWWTGAKLDRPYTGGYQLNDTPRNRKLAARLARAIEAGAVCLRPEIKHDVHGKSYVSDYQVVLGRTMNADLKRLGY